MEAARKEFKDFRLSLKHYQSRAATATIQYLSEQCDYKFVREIASGGFGQVIELKHPETEMTIAAKIVIKELVKENERKEWPLLDHDNLLPLLGVDYIPSTYSYVFITPLLSKSLDEVIADSSLVHDSKGIEKATSYLSDISNGLKYLHEKKLCHLDIKTTNVLISEANTAVICDFGSLTRTDGPTNKYISPFYCKPPEAFRSENKKKSVVNGFKYDIYTYGMLALDLMTNEALFKALTWSREPQTWVDDIYPKMVRILEKPYFEEAVKKSFQMSSVTKTFLRDVRDFVRACLNANSLRRPPADALVEHKIFGGEQDFKEVKNDLLAFKYPSSEARYLVNFFISRVALSWNSTEKNNQTNEKLQQDSVDNKPAKSENETAAENKDCEKLQQDCVDNKPAKSENETAAENKDCEKLQQDCVDNKPAKSENETAAEIQDCEKLQQDCVKLQQDCVDNKPAKSENETAAENQDCEKLQQDCVGSKPAKPENETAAENQDCENNNVVNNDLVTDEKEKRRTKWQGFCDWISRKKLQLSKSLRRLNPRCRKK